MTIAPRTERKELTEKGARGPKLISGTPITTGNSYIESHRENNHSMRPLVIDHPADASLLDSTIQLRQG